MLATEYGFDPERMIEWRPSILDAVISVHHDRVIAAQKAAQRH